MSSLTNLRESILQSTAMVQDKYPFWTAFVLLSGVWSIFEYGTVLLKFVGSFVWTGGNIKQYASPGSWAVVTGATDGIGLEFVRQLSKKGFNILLISRNTEKLSDIALEIEGRNAEAKTKTFAMDFSRPTDEQWSTLQAMFNSLDIAVLVNNVGKSHDCPVSFAQTSIEEMDAVVKINVYGTLRVTRMVLPGMLQRRKKSLILNLGSFSGMIPTPLLSTYAATKAFLVHFNRSLEGELAGTKVDAKLLNTYYVVSAMSKIRRPSVLIPTPNAFVTSVLAHPNAVGRGTGARSAPFWSHALIEFVIEKFIGSKNALLVGYVKGMNESIRRRALKKMGRESDKKA